MTFITHIIKAVGSAFVALFGFPDFRLAFGGFFREDAFEFYFQKGAPA